MSVINNFILFLFLLLLLFYLTTLSDKRDIYIFSICVLIIIYIIYKNNISENFVDYTTIQIDETITDIASNLIIYLTVFNQKSIDGKSIDWNDISLVSTNKKDCLKGPKNFNFSSVPVFNKINGVYLGNNRLIGPYCNELGINFSDKFSILLAVKHGNLLSNTLNEIELIKLYANSGNNNGLSLFIKVDTINNVNNVQTGNLLIKYIDKDPILCKIDKDHDSINLDKDILSFYFIIKDSDNIRVLYLSEKSNVINQIVKINISTTDITFSNKELVVNRFLNWNASIFNFGLYNTAITDDLVGTTYSHIMTEYIKNKDPLVNKLVPQYNSIVDYLNSTKKCPFDKVTCDSCGDIQDWTNKNLYNLSSTNKNCKTGIATYCLNNSKNPLCVCWDSSNTMFNDPICVSIRDNYSGKISNKLDELNEDDLLYIKNKYNINDKCNKDIIKSENNYPIPIIEEDIPIELDFKYTPVVLNKIANNEKIYDLNDYLNNKYNIKNNTIDPLSTFVREDSNKTNFFDNFYSFMS